MMDSMNNMVTQIPFLDNSDIGPIKDQGPEELFYK
jgi:hypothetical protein